MTIWTLAASLPAMALTAIVLLAVLHERHSSAIDSLKRQHNRELGDLHAMYQARIRELHERLSNPADRASEPDTSGTHRPPTPHGR